MSHKERAGYLTAIATELDARTDELARIWVTESGVTHNIAKAATRGLGGKFRFYAGLADTYTFQEEHKTSAGSGIGLLVREPVGVVAAIVPWNHPGALISNKTAPALAGGLHGCREGFAGSAGRGVRHRGNLPESRPAAGSFQYGDGGP